MAVIRLFQPNLALCPAIQEFIKQNLDCVTMEDGRDAEFQLGFASLRRAEIKRLVRKYEVLDEEGMKSFESLAGEDMKARAEQWFAEGKFPVTRQVDEIAVLKAEMEEMRRMMSGEQQVTNQVTEYESMPWHDLRKAAKEKGVLDLGDSKEQILEKLNG